MNLREIRFGIEIETVNLSRAEAARVIHSVIGSTCTGSEVTDRQGRTWHAKHDGSLFGGNGRSAEVVSPVLTYADLDELQQVVRALRAAGARVNQTCGLHIHVDAAAFDGRHLAILAKQVYKQEAILLEALGVSAPRQARYTKPVEPAFIAALEARQPRTRDELNPLWYGYRENHPEHYHGTRYHGLNLHSVWYRGTVEFRYFEGTLHAGKVKAYVQFCLAVAAAALNARSASSRQRPFSRESAKYDFRCWLLRLGLIGDEFKTCRKHLLDRLPGSAAWKRGRPATAA